VSTETPEPTETEAFERVCKTLVERILAGEVERDEVEKAKLEACSEHSAPKVPKTPNCWTTRPRSTART